MKAMRPVAGSVEASVELRERAAGMGIAILSGAVEKQNQDITERYILTVSNGVAAAMLDQDLLGPRF